MVKKNYLKILDIIAEDMKPATSEREKIFENSWRRKIDWDGAFCQ